MRCRFAILAVLISTQTAWALEESYGYPNCEHDGVEVTVDSYPTLLTPSRLTLQTKDNFMELPRDMQGGYFNTKQFGQIQVGFFPGSKVRECSGAVRLHGAPLSFVARVAGFREESKGLYERNLEFIRVNKRGVKYDRMTFVVMPMIVDRFECITGEPLDLPLDFAACREINVAPLPPR